MLATIISRKTASGDTYRAIIRVAGQPTLTRTFKTRTQAKLWAQREEAKIRDGEVRDVAKIARQRTVGDLITAYEQRVLPNKGFHIRRVEPDFLKWWNKRVGSYALALLTPEILSQHLAELASGHDRPCPEGTDPKPRARQTVKQYRDTLERVFKKGIEWRWMAVNPMSGVDRITKINNQRTRYLTDGEREELLKACRRSKQKFLYVIVVFALSTGARKGEILGLRVSDVNLDKGFATFHKTKNAQIRRVHIVGHLRDVLEGHMKVVKEQYGPSHRREMWLFPREDGFAPLQIGKVWRTARTRAELNDFRFHDLRHTAASYMAMNGATLLEIAEVLGHRTLQMVKRYAHLSEDHTAKVVRKMNARMFGKPAKDASGSKKTAGKTKKG